MQQPCRVLSPDNTTYAFMSHWCREGTAPYEGKQSMGMSKLDKSIATQCIPTLFTLHSSLFTQDKDFQ